MLSDALGAWHDLPLGGLRPGGNRVELDLTPLAGRSGAITYPLSLRGLVTDGRTALRLTGLSADGRDVPVPSGAVAFGPSREPGPLPVVLTPRPGRLARPGRRPDRADHLR
ncbi:hypothetical protein ACFSTC_39265 [Nonomuraea ferruginea]